MKSSVDSSNIEIGPGSIVEVAEQLEQALAGIRSNFDIVANEITDLQQFRGMLPDRTPTKSLRNIAGNSIYGKSKQGGTNTQYWARQVVPIYDTIKAGETVKIVLAKVSSYQEATNGTLNNTPCQIGVEYPPLSGVITPAYFSNGALTKTFDSDPNDELLDFTPTIDIPAGAIVHVHVWHKNSIMVCESGDIRRKLNTAAASTFIGDMFRRTTDATSYNNNSMALFTDSANGITAGMSDTTRNALTCDLLQVNGSYWHFGILGILKVSDIVSFASIGDSTDARAGSGNSNITDDSYTYGVSGRILGRRFPVLSCSGANDAIFRWVDIPGNTVIRRNRMQWVSHISLPMGRNDIPAFTTDASVPGMLAKFDQFFAFPEFEGKPFVTYTLPIFNATSSAQSDHMTTLANSFSNGGLARKEYNKYMKTKAGVIKTYDLEMLFNSPSAFYKLAIPTNARTVVGNVAAGSDILELTTGDFYPFGDYRLNASNNNFGGTGVVGVRKMKILSNTKAKLSATVSVAINNENIYIGGYHWVAGPSDFIHMSDNYYNALYLIGEKGLFSEGLYMYNPAFI